MTTPQPAPAAIPDLRSTPLRQLANTPSTVLARILPGRRDTKTAVPVAAFNASL